MNPSRKMSLGIDLGTTFSSLSFCNASATPTRIKFANEGRQLQSAVLIEDDGTVHVGRKARLAAYKYPDKLQVQFKRLIPTAPDVPITPAGPTPIELSSHILKHCWKTICEIEPSVQQAVADGDCKIVVTVPASYRTKDQQAIQRAADLVGDGFQVDQFYSEPVAGSHWFRQHHGEKLREGQKVAVVDVGGGTTDITILQYKHGKFDEMVADRGDPQLGGINFTGTTFRQFCDSLALPELAPCFNPKSGLDFSEMSLGDADRRRAAALWEKCDELKHALSSSEKAEAFLETPVGLVELAITVDEFVKLNEANYAQFERAVLAAIDGTSLSWSDINHVIVIGGSAMLPNLRGIVAGITERSVDEVYLDIDSESVVSDGAAYLGYSSEEAAHVVAGGCGIGVLEGASNGNGHGRSVVHKMFFRPGHVITAAGETVEDLGQYIDAPGGRCAIALEFCEAKPGVQVAESNGTLPLLSSDQVVPIHSLRADCDLPPGRHEVLIGFDYSNRILKYRLMFKDQPDVEVISGNVVTGSSGQDSATAVGYDLAILLDCSSSMRNEQKLAKAKEAVHNLLLVVRNADVQVALVEFGRQVQIVCPLNDDPKMVRESADKLIAAGNTPMAEAIRLGIGELTGTEGGRKQIIAVVSDGWPNNTSEAVEEASRAAQVGIKVVTVGVGDDVSENLLRYRIASSPEDYFFASSAHELVKVFESIAELYIL